MYEQFQDVGLMTGDVAINPSASCLVMTTEVCSYLSTNVLIAVYIYIFLLFYCNRY